MAAPNKPAARQPLSPVANLVLVGVALGFSYTAFSVAVDKGSILLYITALVFFGLAIKNLTQAYTGWKERKK